MKVKVFTAFSGYDSQCLALERLHRDYPDFEYELVGWSEIDPQAIIAHDALFPEAKDKNFGDISKIDWNEVPDFDLFTYSFPCGLAGTLVKTIGGYRKIEDVQEGDLVLTHNNRYRKVTRTMSRNAPSYYDIKAVGCHLRLTGEHPLYVLRDGEEQWVKVKDLNTTDKVSYCVPDVVDDVDISDDVLWLVGRYVADGYVNPLLYHSVEFAIGFEKGIEFERHLGGYPGFRKTEKTCWEYRIADGKLQSWCLSCGSGATNKRIPKWVLDLPVERLEIFLDGYFSGDGHVRSDRKTKTQTFSTVSKELAMGIQMCLLKVYHKVCSISVRKDDRKESFNDTYNGQISFGETKGQELIGGRIYVPVKSIEENKGSVRVYNISVDGDESYTCDNVNTHNCQDISNAGLQRGFEKGSGSRSSLLWECEKAVKAKRPRYLLMENVKALVQKKFLPEFGRWLSLLEDYGYYNNWQVLNAKHFNVPQNRERVFAISILRTQENPEPIYHFPREMPLEYCLSDILEENVDESYFLRDEMLARFCQKSVSEETAPELSDQDVDSEPEDVDFESWTIA